MIQKRLFITLFLAIVASGITLFAMVELYERYKAQQIINELNEAAQKALEEINEKKEQLARANALKESQRKAKIQAKEKANELARLNEITAQKERAEKARVERLISNNFEKWYEIYMPDKCKTQPNYDDLNVECINDKIKAKREYRKIYFN